MASAFLNRIGLSPENILQSSQKYSSYGWFSHEDASKFNNKRLIFPVKSVSDLPEVSDPVNERSDLPEESDTTEFDGFEFRLEDPVMMLPADELFSDGKLVPLQFSVIRNKSATSTTTILSGVDSPDTPTADPYLYSPRAPRCSSRWKELLGFGKPNQSSNNNTGKVDNKRSTSASSQINATGATTTRSIRQFLYRSSKSSHDSSINVPLPEDADTESVSVSSRPSLSSSSSGHDIDDLPRLSLDSDKQGKLNLTCNPNPSNRPKTRIAKTRTQSTSTSVGRSTLRRSSDVTLTGNRGLSVDSPRMNSSGKIVFHGLERSSSSLIGGQRFNHRGMVRSYSGDVRITPVLNVPVCSIKSGGMFGFPIFSTQQKREGCSSSNNGGSNRSQRLNGKGSGGGF